MARVSTRAATGEEGANEDDGGPGECIEITGERVEPSRLGRGEGGGAFLASRRRTRFQPVSARAITGEKAATQLPRANFRRAAPTSSGSERGGGPSTVSSSSESEHSSPASAQNLLGLHNFRSKSDITSTREQPQISTLTPTKGDGEQERRTRGEEGEGGDPPQGRGKEEEVGGAGEKSSASKEERGTGGRGSEGSHL